MFGCNGKYNFPEIAFLLTIIYPFDPEMNLRSHFHFNSFPGHSPRTATQREERSETQNKRTHSNTLRSTHIAPIHERSTNQREHRSDPLRSTNHRPINERAPIQLSETHTGPATSVTEPTTYHGEFSVTGSPSTHSPHLRPTHVRSTHSPRQSDLCIYLFIYLFTFILFITFFNYQCFIKLCIYGLCI